MFVLIFIQYYQFYSSIQYQFSKDAPSNSHILLMLHLIEMRQWLFDWPSC